MSLTAERPADLEFGNFRILRSAERLTGPDGPIKLGNKAMRVLILLAQNPGALVTKEILFSSVWDGTIVSESALTSVIKELRKALGDESRAPRFIESAYGRGYRFIGEVREAASQPEQYRPVPRSAALSAAAPLRKSQAGGTPPLILVAAFNDEAIRDRLPHLGSGLREEVLSGLARFREIRLVADARPEAAESLAYGQHSDRDYVLSAMLIPQGEGARIVVRAKRLSDARVVWAETLSLAATGLAGGIETIVRRIVGAALPAVDEDVLKGLPDETEDLYDRYLIAKHQSFTARDFAEAKTAADALEKIIAERPGFGLPYAPLARLYNIDFGYTALGSSGPAERARALELAKASLAADRGNVHAHNILGFCQLWHGQNAAARDCFERGLALNPYNYVRLNEVATGLMFLGDFSRARELFDQCLHLQPESDPDIEDRIHLAMLEDRIDELRSYASRMTEARLWGCFYEAISATDDLKKGEDSMLGAWRRRISACWHKPEAPSLAEIEKWILFHHPYEANVKARFCAKVRSALASLRD